MKTAVPQENIDGMVQRVLDRVDESEEEFREGICRVNPCGSSVMDQMWRDESAEVKATTTREVWEAEMIEYVVERFHAVKAKGKLAPA